MYKNTYYLSSFKIYYTKLCKIKLIYNNIGIRLIIFKKQFMN